MQIVVEIIGLLVNFEYPLCANFVTSTALAIVPFLTFILMGLLDISGQFHTYLIPLGSQETLNKEVFFRSLTNNVILKC